MPAGLQGVDLPAVGYSIVASLVFAVAANLQRSAAAKVPVADGGSVKLFLRLVRSRRWLLGALAGFVGLGLHTVALGRGGVILVQAILAAGLVAALAVEAAAEHRWLSRGELLGSVMCVVGVAMVLGIGRPGGGQLVDVRIQVLCGIALLAVMAVAVVMSHWHHRVSLSAVVMGAVAGACFAIDAVFLKGIATWGHGGLPVGPALVNLAGFLAASICGNIVVQRAYQRAPLRLVLPAVTVGDPLAAFAIGKGLLGEHLTGGPGAGTAVAIGLTAMTVGIVITATHNPHRDSTPESAGAVSVLEGAVTADGLSVPAAVEAVRRSAVEDRRSAAEDPRQ